MYVCIYIVAKMKNITKNNVGTDTEISRVNLLKPFVSYATLNKEIFLQSAKIHGTPQYLLDEDLLIDNLNNIKSEFSAAIPQSKLFYAFKSNDLPYMISLLQKQGVGADVSCMFEMRLAVKLKFKEIIYTAPYKSDEELEFALHNNVIINVDNVSEFSRIVELYAKNSNKKDTKSKIKIAKLSFRIYALDSWKKFGLELNDFLILAKETLKNKNLSWVGVHFHKSWNINSDSYVNNLKMISDFLKNNFTNLELKNLKFIDIGGGIMPFESVSIKDNIEIPASIHDFATGIGIVIKEYINKKLNITPEIWLEPGRSLSSLPTTILLTVDSVKDDAILVDGGFNLLGYSLFEEEYYPVINISRPSLELNTTKINGPLCDPSDHWGSWYFGDKLKKGDVIAVLNQGAYAFSTAWRWQRPISKYVAFSGSNKNTKGNENSKSNKSNNNKLTLTIVKTEETFKDRYAGCKF